MSFNEDGIKMLGLKINEGGIKMPGFEINERGIKMPGLEINEDRIKMPGLNVDGRSGKIKMLGSTYEVRNGKVYIDGVKTDIDSDGSISVTKGISGTTVNGHRIGSLSPSTDITIVNGRTETSIQEEKDYSTETAIFVGCSLFLSAVFWKLGKRSTLKTAATIPINPTKFRRWNK